MQVAKKLDKYTANYSYIFEILYKREATNTCPKKINFLFSTSQFKLIVNQPEYSFREINPSGKR